MALVFGGATSDRVDHGTATAIDNPTSLTLALWCFPTTLTGGNHYMSKGRTSANVGWRFILGATPTNMQFVWHRATTTQNFLTSDTPITTDKWWFVAVTSDGAGGNVHIYHGDLTSLAVESTYGTTIAGVGALSADAARSLFVGNEDMSGTPSKAFQGRIAVAAYWRNTVLTLNELRSFQFQPRRMAGQQMLAFYHNTGTVADYTGNGNSGVVTGTTIGPHVPLPAPWGYRQTWPMLMPLTVPATSLVFNPVPFQHILVR